MTDVTNSSAELQERFAFDPWGRRSTISGAGVVRTGFTGHRLEPTSGAWLTLHRAYDSEMGRWSGEDPIGLVAGPNRYAYVPNTLVRYVDPLGLLAPAAAGAAVIAVRASVLLTVGLFNLIYDCTEAIRCRNAKSRCIEECGEETLERPRQEYLFDYCVNECMTLANCR